MPESNNKTTSSCCGPNSSCCGSSEPKETTKAQVSAAPQTDGITRRQFLAGAGAASVAMLMAGLPRWAAGSGEVRMSEHLIPKEKNLPAGWLKSLTDKGEPGIWKDRALRQVGMPSGGIGAGQMYFCGDGTLGQWEIFNEHVVPGHGLPSYVRRTIPKPVRHGLALYWNDGGNQTARMLDESGFADVSFQNSHPIGTVTYSDPDCPFKVTMDGFSPFIPLNAKDSALPATLMVVTVENTSDHDIKCGTASWLENTIGRKAHAKNYVGQRTNRIVANEATGRISLSATGNLKPLDRPKREAVVFQDFESTNFGDWKAEGNAFSAAPTTGNLPTQQNVTGWEGKGFAGSFRERDATTGKLVSPTFKINHRYINFKVGGGDHAGEQGIVLLIDGKVVRTGTGRNIEELEWKSWDVSEFEGKDAVLEIRDSTTGGWGHTQVDHIEFSDDPRSADSPAVFDEFTDAGTLAWGVAEPLLDAAAAAPIIALLGNNAANVIPEAQPEPYPLNESKTSGIATRAATIKPGEKKTFVHAIAWHFPNTQYSKDPDGSVGHYYAALYPDADAVLTYIMDNQERLIADTRKWRDTWYDSSLPWWLLERMHLTSCCLATGTTMWWENERYWCYEGVMCCVGTCTHVYNYVQTVARLFPELERNTRERQDLKLGVGLEPSGLVGFRHDGAYAADGQCGTVLKVYREHKMSADDSFLKRNWPHTKMVLDYSISRDGNADGIMEDLQHNTYDVDFYGPNTFVGALYLAALRAGEEMAREMGETAYADKVHAIYEKGRAWTEKNLWNGEYFIQQVDLEKHPQHQYAKGCLSDQMFGQNWAHQLELGYIYDPAKVKRALQSVWEYNWAPDLGPYNEVYPAQRIFAAEAEAGLFNCSWPHTPHLENAVLYRDEVWSGVEYQVASHMVYEDMQTEALAICRAVHDRYSPARRNPYNEIECSDFYSRAMASWGMLLGLSGYHYHGPKGHMAFAPRISPENFRCAFNAAEGWGTFEQKDAGAGREWTLAVKHGQVKLNTLDVPARGSGTAKITSAGTDVESSQSIDNGILRIHFTEVVFEEGAEIKIALG